MSFWKRLFKSGSNRDLRPQRLDYLNEGLALERQGDYDAALTSYRLALRDDPADPRVLQNIAIAYSKTRQYDEAIRFYRKALDVDGSLGGAHYGLAFLLLRRGDEGDAANHLREFLARPPQGPEGQKWVAHAQQTLSELQNGARS
jgi:tetratricopeptide (TPR) repeat protein